MIFVERKYWILTFTVGYIFCAGHLVYQEANNGINCSGKPKVTLIIMGGYGQKWSWLGHGTLTSAVSQEWIDALGWLFACCTNSGKLKITLIGMVKMAKVF